MWISLFGKTDSSGNETNSGSSQTAAAAIELNSYQPGLTSDSNHFENPKKLERSLLNHELHIYLLLSCQSKNPEQAELSSQLKQNKMPTISELSKEHFKTYLKKSNGMRLLFERQIEFYLEKKADERKPNQSYVTYLNKINSINSLDMLAELLFETTIIGQNGKLSLAIFPFNGSYIFFLQDYLKRMLKILKNNATENGPIFVVAFLNLVYSFIGSEINKLNKESHGSIKVDTSELNDLNELLLRNINSLVSSIKFISNMENRPQRVSEEQKNSKDESFVQKKKENSEDQKSIKAINGNSIGITASGSISTEDLSLEKKFYEVFSKNQDPLLMLAFLSNMENPRVYSLMVSIQPGPQMSEQIKYFFANQMFNYIKKQGNKGIKALLSKYLLSYIPDFQKGVGNYIKNLGKILAPNIKLFETSDFEKNKHLLYEQVEQMITALERPFDVEKWDRNSKITNLDSFVAFLSSVIDSDNTLTNIETASLKTKVLEYLGHTFIAFSNEIKAEGTMITNSHWIMLIIANILLKTLENYPFVFDYKKFAFPQINEQLANYKNTLEKFILDNFASQPRPVSSNNASAQSPNRFSPNPSC